MVLGDIGGWDTALEDIYRACQSNDEVCLWVSLRECFNAI